MTTNALWYLARGAGTVSLVLLTTVMVLGIGSRSGRTMFGLPRFAVVSLHRNVSLLALGLLALHLVSLLLDPYAQIKLVNLLIPFQSVYRPFWVGLGTLAIDLMVVVLLTTWLRHFLGARVWRTVHWAAYASWPFAVLHALFSGTDIGRGWLRIIACVCILAVTAAVVWRLSERFTEASRLRAGTPDIPRPAPPSPDGLSRLDRSR